MEYIHPHKTCKGWGKIRAIRIRIRIREYSANSNFENDGKTRRIRIRIMIVQDVIQHPVPGWMAREWQLVKGDGSTSRRKNGTH
jgi:hypothetical protein